MSGAPVSTTPMDSKPSLPTASRTLRRLYLTLFLRGRSARGLQKDKAVGSIARKLALTLFFYALIGLVSLTFLRMPLFALSAYLHALTFSFLGMFLASSAGEVLFNKEETDILAHRPITPQEMLWAKVRVLVEVSLWIAGAINLVGFAVGYSKSSFGPLFLFAHALSLLMESLFAAGCVVLVYQVCLRWFGRERLEGILTTAQIVLSVGIVVGSQFLPQMMFRKGFNFSVTPETWWILLIPPAWFAGFDDALAGTGTTSSGILAAVAVVSTVTVVCTAFVKLAGDYGTGLQQIHETVSHASKRRAGKPWLDRFIERPPLSWWLRDPVERSAFLLSIAYLVRDRDVKLRVYPAIAPMMAMPAVMLAQDFVGRGADHGFGLSFAASYLVIIPLMGISMLQYSQQWQAADIFRAVPIGGPSAICHGARKAVMFLLAVPTVLIFALIILWGRGEYAPLLLLLPGIIAMPVYGLVPSLGGNGVPLSLPTEEAKSAGRGLTMIFTMLFSFLLSGLATWAWVTGWFHWFLLAEGLLSLTLFLVLRRSINRSGWVSLE